MFKHFKSLLAWMALLASVVAILYVAAYFVLVKRVEQVNMARFYERGSVQDDGIICRTGSMHYVFPEAPAFLTFRQWYAPLARFDNAFIRHHRWQSYKFMYSAGATEIAFIPEWNETPPLLTSPTVVVEIFETGTSREELRHPVPPDEWEIFVHHSGFPMVGRAPYLLRSHQARTHPPGWFPFWELAGRSRMDPRLSPGLSFKR